ncbi:MAG: gamma-glutamyltransferase [candidate division NC10 bacterium]|nr:gamma-glutamyltransferase [candidate division NC10 bacterium]
MSRRYTSRPTVLAPKALVTSPHYLASEAGIAVLRDGGNAVEAAVATAAVLCVVYPHMTSIGGDNFWLIYDVRRRQLRGLNASGRVGERCTIEFYRQRGYTQFMPPRGLLSANATPGAVDGWWEAYQYSRRRLKGRLPWGMLFQEAIRYAKEGFPVTAVQEEATLTNLDTEKPEVRYLQRFEGFRRLFLKKNRPLRSGEMMIQQDLARTLGQIAREGRDAFYRGAVARRVLRFLEHHGGILTRGDFETHRSEWVEPLSVSYRGHRMYSLPPNSQGIAFLMLMGVLDRFNLQSIGEGSAEYLHLIVEVTKRVFEDRNRWVTDPHFVHAPIRRLLSRPYLAAIARAIGPVEQDNGSRGGTSDGDTVWLGVVDESGNAVSLIQSIYFDFGSGIVADDTGVLLQNRGSAFSLDPAHPNALAPRKRTFHTLMPAMVFRRGRPYLVLGTMGGEGQPQTLTAITTRIIDFGMTVQEAIEAPRWLFGRTWALPERALYVEGRFPRQMVQTLTERGHRVHYLSDWDEKVGQAQVILIHPETGVRHGGADPRADGMALGY